MKLNVHDSSQLSLDFNIHKLKVNTLHSDARKWLFPKDLCHVETHLYTRWCPSHTALSCTLESCPISSLQLLKPQCHPRDPIALFLAQHLLILQVLFCQHTTALKTPNIWCSFKEFVSYKNINFHCKKRGFFSLHGYKVKFENVMWMFFFNNKKKRKKMYFIFQVLLSVISFGDLTQDFSAPGFHLMSHCLSSKYSKEN